MKESYYTQERPNSLVFREAFSNESECVNNGGDPTDVTFENGVGRFNGTSSFISYPVIVAGNYSVRIKLSNFISDGATQFLVDFGVFSPSSGYVYITNTTLIAATGGTRYIDGQVGVTVTTETTEIVATGVTLNPDRIVLGARGTGTTNFLEANLELVEIYNYTLSAEEVSNLYDNSRHIKPTGSTLLEVTAERGVIEDRAGNVIINTDVDVVRDGGIWVHKYNGATSRIDFGEITLSRNNATLSIWFNNWHSTPILSCLLGNNFSGYKILRKASATATQLESDTNGDFWFSYNVPITDDDWHNIIVVANSGVTSAYLDTVFINGRTPSNDITLRYIGSHASGGNWAGNIGEVIFDNTAWDEEKVSQYFTATKYKYSK